jgi:tricorn protease
MKRLLLLVIPALLAALLVQQAALARAVRLARYPHYHEGRVAFTYLADIWTADEDGKNVQRLTVHTARDAYPRFSPDGKWIAFSSDRQGNLDVYLVPSGGGTARQLTFHSADDTVQGWAPDGRAVLFASQRGEDFMTRLYTVSVEGGMPKNAGADMGYYACYSPDGKKLAVNRKTQSYWRKGYRGSYQSDVTVADLESKRFTDLTDFNGMDTWPMWSRDGHIYFVSDREPNAQTNIWRVPEGGGKAEQVTSFKDGDVRWPAMSADGRTIVFERDFGVWKLDLRSRQAKPVPLDIEAEVQQNLAEVREFNSRADDFDLAPSGRRVALSVHGEIFTAPVDEGDLRQITDGPARDQDPHYSPDGKWIAYVTDRSGREEIWVAAADGAGEHRKLTDVDALKNSFAWSPDSKQLAYTASDNRLRLLTVEDGRTVELASSRFGNIGAPVWSPDGKWLAFSKPDLTRNTDVYLVSAAGGEERKITFDADNESNPRFSADGKTVYFVRSEGFTGAGRPAAQIHAVVLERQERDPSEPEERPERGTRSGEPGARNQERGTRNIDVDWGGLKRRTRQVTRMPFAVFNYAVAPAGGSLAFVTTEPAGTRNVPVLYTVSEDGRRLTRLSSGAASGDDEGEGRGRRGGFGGGMSSLQFSADGRSLFFMEGGSISSVSVGGGGAGAGGGRFGGGSPGGGEGASGGRRRVSFTAKVRVDAPAEWAQMFDDAWRTMKYRFYDPEMHGKDWDAIRARYRPVVEYVGDRQELLNVVNEMIGELNASHTGASAGGGRGGGVSTAHLGLELEPDERAGRYRVTHVYEEGPADKDWVKIAAGNYLIALDGKPVKAGDNYWQLLNHRLNRKVEVTLNDKPAEEGAWKTRVEPTTTAGYSQLRYERWVKERRALVDRLSSGRIGYVHIHAMNQSSLRRFEKELREYRGKEALVIDQRWNGGGNIEQELLAILVQRPYQVWQPRGSEPVHRPFAAWVGPKVVLQNWRSGSNAEMFPAGFRALGLGKVIGTPTVGAVIGTGSYSLIDGSSVRTPSVGVFLNDGKRTNLENTGVQPDILVENTPEDNLAGRDRQLERGVEELLKELNNRPAPVAAGSGR